MQVTSCVVMHCVARSLLEGQKRVDLRPSPHVSLPENEARAQALLLALRQVISKIPCGGQLSHITKLLSE